MHYRVLLVCHTTRERKKKNRTEREARGVGARPRAGSVSITDGHTTERRPQWRHYNTQVKISPGKHTHRHTHTGLVVKGKVFFFIISIVRAQYTIFSPCAYKAKVFSLCCESWKWLKDICQKTCLNLVLKSCLFRPHTSTQGPQAKSSPVSPFARARKECHLPNTILCCMTEVQCPQFNFVICTLVLSRY